MTAQQEFSNTSIVLVTGANGHVAQHVVSQLLSRPVPSRPKVRATIRSDSAVSALKLVFDEQIASGYLELVQIPDIAVPGAFDEVVKGCTHIAHIASPLVVGAKNTEQDVLIPAVQGTTGLLQSVAKSETVQSVVITSSFAAVFDAMFDLRPGYTYTPADWNPISYDTAADPALDLSTWPPRYQNFITYMASKKLAEKAAWDFYAAQRPSWRLSVVCPTYIGGPTILPLSKGAQSLSYSDGLIWNAATSKPEDKLPEIDFPYWVDVRDVAKAHILALVTPEASGQRFILANYKVTYSAIADIARSKLGMNPSTQEQVLNSFNIVSDNCENILGMKDPCVSFEEMVRETVKQVQKAEQILK